MHSPNVGIEYIHPHHESLTKNRDMKDWGTHEHGIEAVTCRLLNSRPALNLPFLKKVRQGGSNTHEVVHILAIVVAQTKELLYMSDTGGRGPLTNCQKLDWVYVDLAMANYVAQVVDFAMKKHTFLYLCI